MSDYLYHHGILGQKWGVRNGPPYPLDEEDHSSREKKAISTKKTGFENENSNNSTKKKSNSTGKTLLKIGAISAASVLAAYGGYKLLSSDLGKELIANGKILVDSILIGSSSEKNNRIIGRSFRNLDKKMIEGINQKYYGTPEGKINCLHCSVAYIMNTVFGENVTASPVYGVDEKSGMKLPGRDINLLTQLFDNVVEHDFLSYNTQKTGDNYKKTFGRQEYAKAILKGYLVNSPKGNEAKVSLEDAFKSVKNGSTGIVMIPGHFFNYEKSNSGQVSLIDCQSDFYDPINKSKYTIFPAVRIWDFSNASIKPESENILRSLLEKA